MVFFVTDPARTPNPLAIARRLPRGSGVIFRGFGRKDALETALQLAAIARRQGLILLIGADDALAARVGASGVHLPERLWGGLRRLKARRPNWIITLAAHSPGALRRAGSAHADAVLLSSVFDSRSPSAGRPIGPIKLALLARSSPAPVFALGGVNARTAKRLIGTGISGFAATEAFADAS